MSPESSTASSKLSMLTGAGLPPFLRASGLRVGMKPGGQASTGLTWMQSGSAGVSEQNVSVSG